VGYWWRFLRACKRLRATGLRRSKNLLRTRLAWALAGNFTGIALVATAVAALRVELRGAYFGFAAILGSVALIVGERIGEVADVDAVKREHWDRISLKHSPEDEE